VAAGEKLSWSQADLKQRGHALECRIYAEDAAAGFLPAAGKAFVVVSPSGPGVRFDYGLESGDDVTVYYDPIIGKLITKGVNRKSSIRRMAKALEEMAILGLTTNIDFLKEVLEHPAFAAGDLHIGFLDENLPHWKPAPLSEKERLLALALAGMAESRTVAAAMSTGETSRLPEPWQTLGRWEICGGSGR